MSPEENFAGINPERLKMLQARENTAPRDFSGRGRDRGRGRGGRGGRGGGSGGGRGSGRGGYRANGRRFVFNDGVGSPAAVNGGTKESTPAEEQLSGAEMRLAFKRNQERRSGAAVEKCANGVNGEERKRKRDDEDAVPIESSPPKTSKGRGNGKTNGVATVTNGTSTLDEKRKHKKKEKRDDRTKRAKKHAIELEEEAAEPPSRTPSSYKQLDDDPNLSKEAKRAAKKERKEKREKRKAAIIEEPVDGDVGSSEHTSGSKPKPKKDKKPKKGKYKEPSSSSTEPAPAKKSKKSKTEVSAGEVESKWTAVAADLPGDDQRKSKFLRLLGAGAGAAATVPTANGSASLSLSSSSSTKTRERDLERQYDAGLKMKAEKRRGLGA
ncbi:hypothetical protein HOY80DRAFT_758325 [Tuber brumale]|nr:hypothetical protein HOY80DRAFT_758325 [Tuber brumale]